MARYRFRAIVEAFFDVEADSDEAAIRLAGEQLDHWDDVDSDDLRPEMGLKLYRVTSGCSGPTVPVIEDVDDAGCSLGNNCDRSPGDPDCVGTCRTPGCCGDGEAGDSYEGYCSSCADSIFRAPESD